MTEIIFPSPFILNKTGMFCRTITEGIHALCLHCVNGSFCLDLQMLFELIKMQFTAVASII